MPTKALALILMAALAGGCRPQNAVPADPSGTKAWSNEPNAVPGLDSGHCYYNGKRFLIWTVGSQGSGASAVMDGSRLTTGDGHVSFDGGLKLDYAFELPSGTAGTATVNGADYDLANGCVFLAKIEDGRFVVKQLEKDLSHVTFTGADFAAIGRADPAIKAFFEAGGKR